MMDIVSKDGNTVTWRKSCTDCGCRFNDSMTKFMGRFPIRVKDFKKDTGQCPECSEKQQLHHEKLFFARNLHWTFDSVKEFFTNNPPQIGQELLVLDTSCNINTYALVTVTNSEYTKQKRIVIDGYTNGYSGQSFYRSGKNCFSPKGQVRLLPYNSKIGALIQEGGGREIQLESEKVMALMGEVEPPKS